jgi:Fe-S-cluster-containing hydrogenase component 2/CRP-like cAMP-binding protein
MADDIYLDEIARNWEEEGLFARDVAGRLIRVVERTEQDYATLVTVAIDGQEIVVPKAVPSTDAQGNIIYVDAAGRTMPRATTIYDAARRLYERLNAERRADDPAATPLEIPIPTLCHLDHLRPAGVCRVCSVAAETYEIAKDGSRKAKRQEKLVPACVQPVEANMVVHTLSSPDEKQQGKVAASVKVLLELLAADHLPAVGRGGPVQAQTDLERVVARFHDSLELDPGRFRPQARQPEPRDDSSPLVLVDHDACILCDRCVRACTDVKQNFVIGRTGKGYKAGIGFDLDDPMGHSSCVECGECMLSCPTSALTFRQPVVSDWWKEQVGDEGRGGQPGRSPVTPQEMESNPLLRTLPWRYRQWNQSSIVRWQVKPGDELCRLGEYGSTAFILSAGSFGVWLQDPRAGGKAPENTDLGPPRFVMTPADLILGEMTCLNQYPRNATVRAMEAGEVYEIRRNVLFTLQRSPEARARLDTVYRTRSISNHLRRVPLFAGLSEEERKTCERMLMAGDGAPRPAVGSPPQAGPVQSDREAAARPRVDLVRVEPGQIIYRQGERADCFYMIRFGHVKVTQTYGGEERVLNFLGLNQSFGEIACIGDWPELRAFIPPDLQGPLDNRRSASCVALDHVELVRIDAAAFRQLLQTIEPLKAAIVQQAKDYLSRQVAATGIPVKTNAPAPLPAAAPPPAALADFCDQGLYNSQRLLVLDLEACTRCDECTKACSDTHHGITRLIREGLRFDKWLVASSCRSCTDPYCLLGCPVDAIHRDGKHLEIRIEDHCIGCGLCASNCPYGNINMHLAEEFNPQEGRTVARHRATTCDLCTDIVGDDFRNVSCVFACPHNAAFRMTGPELLKTVQS